MLDNILLWQTVTYSVYTMFRLLVHSYIHCLFFLINVSTSVPFAKKTEIRMNGKTTGNICTRIVWSERDPNRLSVLDYCWTTKNVTNACLENECTALIYTTTKHNAEKKRKFIVNEDCGVRALRLRNNRIGMSHTTCNASQFAQTIVSHTDQAWTSDLFCFVFYRLRHWLNRWFWLLQTKCLRKSIPHFFDCRNLTIYLFVFTS